jgi:hypothetical protein
MGRRLLPPRNGLGVWEAYALFFRQKYAVQIQRGLFLSAQRSLPQVHVSAARRGCYYSLAIEFVLLLSKKTYQGIEIQHANSTCWKSKNRMMKRGVRTIRRFMEDIWAETKRPLS